MTFYASSATSALASPAPARRASMGRVLLAGLGAAVAGSIVWAIIAYLTKHQFSLVAILVGSLVGFTISRIRPGSAAAAAAGAVVALFGCAFGTFLALIFAQVREGAAVVSVLQHPNVLEHAYPRSVGPLGIVFWLMAAAFASANTLGLRHDRVRQAPPGGPWPGAKDVSRQAADARPAPGGYGTPQAPSGNDQEWTAADQPGLEWGLEPVTVVGSAAWPAKSAAAARSGPPAPAPPVPPPAPGPGQAAPDRSAQDQAGASLPGRPRPRGRHSRPQA
jgi:hypothetical protein